MRREPDSPNLNRLRRYDREVLVAAVGDILQARTAPAGRVSTRRTRVFIARYEGICDRCGFPITVGQDIRFHRDFDRFVHNSCRAPTVTVRMAKPVALRQPRTAKEMTAQQPPLCTECHLEHAGVCW